MPIKLKKQIMRIGTFQDSEKQFTITTDLMDRWVGTFKQMQSDGVPCPIVKDHTESVDSAVGKIIDMEREGDFLYAVLEFPTQEAADLTLANDVSVKAVSEYKTGIGTYTNAIRHVSLTPLPLIPGLGDYELVCSISHIQPPTNVKGVDQDMKKIVFKIADLLGVDVPRGISNNEELVLAWLEGIGASRGNKPEDEDVEEPDSEEPEPEEPEPEPEEPASEEPASEEPSDEAQKTEETATDDKNVEPPKDDESKKIKASATDTKEQAKEPEVKEDNAKTDNTEAEKPAEEANATPEPNKEPEPAKDQEENTSKVKQERVEDVEKIKTDEDLAKSAKNITASINSTRKSQLRSFLGRPGISAQKIETWEKKYASSDSLDICCSLQNEYDSLIDGLTCSNASNSILSPNPTIEPTAKQPQDSGSDPGPQFSEWAEKMSKRKGVK